VVHMCRGLHGYDESHVELDVVAWTNDEIGGRLTMQQLLTVYPAAAGKKVQQSKLGAVASFTLRLAIPIDLLSQSVLSHAQTSTPVCLCPPALPPASITKLQAVQAGASYIYTVVRSACDTKAKKTGSTHHSSCDST
jgi:hypothetical protein